jgi:hypothetical protein
MIRCVIMLPNYWWPYPFLIHKPTKILRHESSGNHAITLIWRRNMRSDVCSFKVASCDLGKSCEQRTLGRFCFFKVTNCDHEQRAASASFKKRKDRKRNHPFASHGMMDGFTIRGLLCFLFVVQGRSTELHFSSRCQCL